MLILLRCRDLCDCCYVTCCYAVEIPGIVVTLHVASLSGIVVTISTLNRLVWKRNEKGSCTFCQTPTRNANLAKISREDLAVSKCVFRCSENDILFENMRFASAVSGPPGCFCHVYDIFVLSFPVSERQTERDWEIDRAREPDRSTTNGYQHDHCRLQAIGAEFCKLAQTRESCDLEKAVGVRSWYPALSTSKKNLQERTGM